MGRFTSVIGKTKFSYWRAKYGWKEKNERTGEIKKISWDTAKAKFATAYDRALARKVVRRKGISYKQARILVRDAKAEKISYKELY